MSSIWLDVQFCRVEDVFNNDSLLAQMGVKRGDMLYTRKLASEPVAWRDPSNSDPGQGCTYDKAKHEQWPHIYKQPRYAEKEN